MLRVEKPSAIPVESLHSRKEDLGSTLRLTMRQTLAPEALGEFSLQPQQSAVRAVFVPLAMLQKELDQAGKANLILIAENSRRDSENSTATTATLERLSKEQGFARRLRHQASRPERAAGVIGREFRGTYS